jgi:hypothetical protein
MPSRQEIILEWLGSLAVLVQGSTVDADRLRVFVPFLLKLVPVEAYSAASVQAIARTCRFGMPSYSELADGLEKWWREHRPDKPVAIPYVRPEYRVNIPTNRAPPTEAEIEYVGGVVAALKWDLETAAQQRELARPAAVKPKRQAYLVPDEKLLAIYEAAGPAGVVRAQMLRGQSTGNAAQSTAFDDADMAIAGARLAEMAAFPERVVTGDALERRLDEWSHDDGEIPE